MATICAAAQWPRGRLTVLWDESLPGAPPADEPADIDVAAQVGALSVDERRLLRLQRQFLRKACIR